MQQSKVLGVFRAKCSKETVCSCFMESWGRSGRLFHTAASCHVPCLRRSALSPHGFPQRLTPSSKSGLGSKSWLCRNLGFDFIRTYVKVSFPSCAWCSILQNPVTLPDLFSSLWTLHLVPFTGDHHLMSQAVT